MPEKRSEIPPPAANGGRRDEREKDMAKKPQNAGGMPHKKERAFADGAQRRQESGVANESGRMRTGNREENAAGGTAGEREDAARARYKSMIAGLTPPFVVIEIMFAALAVYLFVAKPEKPLFGGIFLIIAGIVLAVYLAALFALRAAAKRAARNAEREK